MPDQNNRNMLADGLPEAVVYKRRSFSVVWVVPLVAIIIGGWLVVKSLSERGPQISIVFKSAEGLEAGKTRIKYKEVEVGQVDSITLSKDLSEIIIQAELVRDFEPYLTDKTRFWVVRPRVSAGQVSGISTIFSGAYIAVDPGREGNPLTKFHGLENPPAVTTDAPGSRFVLQADKLGSLESGSPVYFKQVRVGQVLGYEFDESRQYINVRIFVHAPYDKLVFKNTKFWNSSGMDFTVDARGLKVDTESIVSILVGGVAFDTPVDEDSAGPAESGDRFVLYANYNESLEKNYALKTRWILEFENSVRGLTRGAPVEFKGIKIGEVEDVNLDLNLEKFEFKLPVLVSIEPERLLDNPQWLSGEKRREIMDELAAKGLRAQLKMGNLVTGQLYVDLNFYPDAKQAEVDWSGEYPKFPTIQTQLEVLTAAIDRLVDRISKLPIEEIADNMRVSISELRNTMKETRKVLTSLNRDISPETMATLVQARKTLSEMETLISSDSSMARDARRAMEELGSAARSIRILMDYLQRHPDSLIYGKGKNNEK